MTGSPTTSTTPGEPASLKRWPLWLALVLATLALAALIPLSLKTVTPWAAFTGFPFQLDAEEGFILGGALTMARGDALYKSIATPPFVVGNYPPLFYQLYGLAIGSRAALDSLPTGRIIVQSAAVAVAILLALIALLRTRRILPALLAPLLFFGTYEVAHWSAFVRVDFPALMFTVAGLGIFLVVRSRWGLPLSAILFVAAGFTRQTAILAPAACALALLLHDRRRLSWFLVPYAGLGLIVLALLEARTGGEFFRHVVTYNKNRMDWLGFARVMKNEVWFFYRWWIAALAAGAAGVVFAWLKMRNDESSGVPPHSRHVLSIYLALSALSLFSYAKVGSAPNYVLEPLAAAALWSAETLGLLLAGLAAPAHRRWTAPAALAFCALLLAHGVYLDLRALPLRWVPVPGPADRAAGRELLQRVRSASGDACCEDPVYTLLAGKPVLFQPFIMSQLAREGKWDERPFLDWLRARRFSIFVATEDLRTGGSRDYERYTPAMAEAVTQNYSLEGSLALPGAGKQLFVWRPKTR